jgi:hypothetical protein
MEQREKIEQMEAATAQKTVRKGQPYERPAIVYETQISTRAGSPVSVFRPEQDPADIWNK